MMKKAGRRMRRPQDKDKSASSVFMKRDGTVVGEVESESVSQMAKEGVKRLSVSVNGTHSSLSMGVIRQAK